MPLLLVTQNCLALEPKPEYIEGISSVNTLPDNLNHQVIIQDKHKAIIHWQDFSIGSLETREFQQPSSNAIVLNRVLGNTVSSIEGALKANGQVWIINPSGILFGKNATVDVGGLLATTSNISDADFLNSKQKYHFHALNSKNAKILNEGHIKVKDSGLAALVAPTVQNLGVIEAHMGKVILGGGTEYTVDLYGDNLIHFSMGSGGELVQSEGVSNTKNAKIITNGGTVLLTTSDALKVVEHVINMEGFIQANTVESHKGAIILSASRPQNPKHKKSLIKINGEIQATGLKPNEKGGKITLSAPYVGLFENANINASGAVEGGNIHIGGEKQGLGTLAHADAVFVSPNVKISADAKTMGKGGEIIVWSDNCTRCYGNLSATGGALGGDGGFIETSGGFIDTQGIDIKLNAPKGMAGTYLWDPYNVEIIAGSSSGGSFDGANVWTPSASGSSVRSIDIVGFLVTDSNVTITTTNAAGFEAGNITVSASIPGPVFALNSAAFAPAMTNTLSMNAEGSIFVNADISSVGTGSYNIGLYAPTGNITLNNPIDLAVISPETGGNATFNTHDLSGAGAVNLTTLTLTAQSANFFGTVGGLTDASNISGMTQSLALYGPNFSGSSRYFFNGNEFFITQIPPPIPIPTPIPTPGLKPILAFTVPANAIIPAEDLFITEAPPTVGDEANIIEIDSSLSSLSVSDISIETNTKTIAKTTKAKTESKTAKTTATSNTNTNTPTVPSVQPIAAPVNTPIVPLPLTPPLPATGPIPPGYDVPIGGVLEPITNFSSELPVPNIEDRAGIPLSIENGIYDATAVKPPVVVSIDNSVGPKGVNGTDVPVGTAGIGSGIQESVLKTTPIEFKKASEIIGASSLEEAVPRVSCPEAPNCIPGVDSFNSYHPSLETKP